MKAIISIVNMNVRLDYIAYKLDCGASLYQGARQTAVAVLVNATSGEIR